MHYRAGFVGKHCLLAWDEMRINAHGLMLLLIMEHWASNIHVGIGRSPYADQRRVQFRKRNHCSPANARGAPIVTTRSFSPVWAGFQSGWKSALCLESLSLFTPRNTLIMWHITSLLTKVYSVEPYILWRKEVHEDQKVYPIYIDQRAEG